MGKKTAERGEKACRHKTELNWFTMLQTPFTPAMCWHLVSACFLLVSEGSPCKEFLWLFTLEKNVQTMWVVAIKLHTIGAIPGSLFYTCMFKCTSTFSSEIRPTLVKFKQEAKVR